MNKVNQKGFTLIELMIVVLIASIALAVATPSIRKASLDNQMAAQVNSLLALMQLARSEAMTRPNMTVTVCGSTDQANCDTANFEEGYIIFADTNGDGTIDAGEQIIKVRQPLGGSLTLRLTGFAQANFMQFDDLGQVANEASFTICDERGAQFAKGVVFNISGQTRNATDEDGDRIANIHDGDLVCPV